MASDRELQEIMRNLNKGLNGIKARSARGLVLAAALVRRETETTPPLTPVDLGNLRASWFVTTPKVKNVQLPHVMDEYGKTVHEGHFVGPESDKIAENHRATIAEAQTMAESVKSGKIVVIMGYTADYALYVHEGPHGRKDAVFQRPGAGIKWFEASVYRDSKKILDIVRDNAKL